jgi:hypothetical protein
MVLIDLNPKSTLALDHVGTEKENGKKSEEQGAILRNKVFLQKFFCNKGKEEQSSHLRMTCSIVSRGNI